MPSDAGPMAWLHRLPANSAIDLRCRYKDWVVRIDIPGVCTDVCGTGPTPEEALEAAHRKCAQALEAHRATVPVPPRT